MIYDIKVRIEYTYPGMAGSGRHLLRLFPRDLPGEQTVLSKEISVTPEPDERSKFLDFFRNETHDVLHQAPHRRLELLVTSRVERISAPAATGTITLDALPSALDVRPSLSAGSPAHFLGMSPRVRPGRDYAEYARANLGNDPEVSAIVRSVGRALNRDLKFDATATDVDTPHEEAFANRHGVCQDFSHIMIACLRSIGIPAGYVSGFLRTLPPPGKPRLEGADAMHAWVQAWCGPDIGWVGYDPTNAIDIGLDHVIVAVGRDYSDVSPVKGVLRASGDHTSLQEVDVVEVSAP